MLVAYFNSGYGHNQLMKLSKGAVIQHIPASILKTLEIPVPTNKFQKRIVEIYHASIDAQQSTMELLKQQKKTSENRKKIINKSRDNHSKIIRKSFENHQKIM